MLQGKALDWSAIDTVMLDMDGTLLDQRFDNWFWRELIPERYARARGITQPEAAALLAPKFRAVMGTMRWYCIEYWSEELGLDIAGIKRTTLEQVGFLPGAQEFLSKLEFRGKRRVLVTNAHPVTLAIKNEQVAGRFVTRTTQLTSYRSPATVSRAIADPCRWARWRLGGAACAASARGRLRRRCSE